MPKEGRVIVEGVNIQTKHQKQTQKEAAEIKHQEGPIDASNVMYYDSKAKAPTRIGYKIENGKKVRVSKKTGRRNSLGNGGDGFDSKIERNIQE